MAARRKEFLLPATIDPAISASTKGCFSRLSVQIRPRDVSGTICTRDEATSTFV